MVTLHNLDAHRVAATFHFPGCIWAERVDLAGNLGDEPGPYPMSFSPEDDEWQLTIVLQPDHVYRYWYVLDGKERLFERQDSLQVPGAKE